MAEEKRVFELGDWDHRLLLACIRTARNAYIEQGKPVEDVNKLMLLALNAPTKKEKKQERREARFSEAR